MSAEVEATAFTARCSYCCEWADSADMTEEDAQAWADQHDTEYHTPETETPS